MIGDDRPIFGKNGRSTPPRCKHHMWSDVKNISNVVYVHIYVYIYRYNYRYVCVYIYIIYQISYIIYQISYITYIYICTHVPGSRNSHPTTLMDRMWDKPQIFARRLGQVDSVFIPPFFMDQKWMKSWRDDLGKQKYHLVFKVSLVFPKKTTISTLTSHRIYTLIH